MLRKIGLKNYKCLRDVEVELEPFTLLVGPNNSGKSSFLEGVDCFTRSLHEPMIPLPSSPLYSARQMSNLAWMGKYEAIRWSSVLELSKDETVAYDFEAVPTPTERPERWEMANDRFVYTQGENETNLFEWGDALQPQALQPDEQSYGYVGRHTDMTLLKILMDEKDFDGRPPQYALPKIRKALSDFYSNIRAYKFAPEYLRIPAPLQPGQIPQLDRFGYGLPVVLDWLLNEHREAFFAIEQELKRFSPDIDSIGLKLVIVPTGAKNTGAGRALEFKLRGTSRKIPSELISDGVMLMLAYLTLLHLPDKPRMMMLEEPDAHIHPRQVKTVMEALRSLSSREQCQVIITTHSPLLVNYAEPKEVRFFTREESGETHIHRMDKVKKINKLLEAMDLGEIWYNFGEQNLATRVL